MKYGVNIPNFGDYGLVENIELIASTTEKFGWDGLFIWDHIQAFPKWHRGLPFVDPWIAMSIIAMKTDKLTLGPFITPLTRRRPWQVFRQAVSLDHLSKGRLILGFGLGNPEFDFTPFQDTFDLRTRAKMLDEGLQLLLMFNEERPVNFNGEHYVLSDVSLYPKFYQKNIPILIAGEWPNKAPMRRAARFDGVVPISINWPEILQPNDVKDLADYIRSHKKNNKNFEIMISGSTPPNDTKSAEIIESYKNAGMTWWSEDLNFIRGDFNSMIERIEAGPPLI